MPSSASVLVVDDETDVREVMTRWLSSGGYAVATAENAAEALSRVQADPPAVAVCDIRMPGQDGLWLARQIRSEAPETALIMATGVQDVGSAVASLQQGVVDYLTKPFGRDRLRDAVGRGVDWHRGALESRRWRASLECELRVRHQRLADGIAGLRIDTAASLDDMLSMLTIDNRDAYDHAHRVAALSVSVGRSLGLSPDEIATIERAALLHDLGKLAVPDAVLCKPAPLTSEELSVLRMHPSVGADLIRGFRYLAASADMVRDAHERVDGLGYPRGLSSADLPIGARIIAVADAYDAMTRPRVFRDPISLRDALLEVTRCAGTQFDPAVVEAFVRVIDAASPHEGGSHNPTSVG